MPFTVTATADETAADDVIGAVLRNEKPAWPWADSVQAIDLFHERCDLHGVNALLHDQLQGSDWPNGVLQVLRVKAIQLAMWELRHQQILAETLAALELAGVKAVLLKGTALAYSLYPDPALRTRADTDLLVAVSEKESAAQTLMRAGFIRNQGMTGEFVSYQASFVRVADGVRHMLDLHWKINNSELLSKLFTCEELQSESQPLPTLSELARGTGPEYSLLIACMHRATHRHNPYHVDGTAHFGGNRLIWLVDVDLLARTLSERQWRNLVTLAEEKGLRQITCDGLEQARIRLGTELPKWVVERLGKPGPAELPALYLNAGTLRQQWLDLNAIRGLPGRLRLLREIVFPPVTYMRRKYPQPAWMPWLYLRRAASGIVKRLGRSNNPS